MDTEAVEISLSPHSWLGPVNKTISVPLPCVPLKEGALGGGAGAAGGGEDLLRDNLTGKYSHWL